MNLKVAYIHNGEDNKAINSLALKIAIACFAISALITQWLQTKYPTGQWIPSISAGIVASVFGAIIFCHNRWFWRIDKPQVGGWCPWLWVTRSAPDLSGKWEVSGETVRHHNLAIIGTRWNGILEIDQKGDTISVNLETLPKTDAAVSANHGTLQAPPAQSRSYAIGAASITSVGKVAILRYIYENSPNSNAQGMTKHTGACDIHFKLSEKTGTGNYFTDHTRGSSGTFTLTKIQ